MHGGQSNVEGDVMFNALYRAGYVPVPLAPGSKSPLLDDWQRWHLPTRDMPWDAWTLSSDQVAAWMRNHPVAGLGVQHGELIGVDIDADELVNDVMGVLPPTPCAKRGRKGCTLFYRNTAGLRSEDFRAPDRRALVQVLSHGKQSAIPPTVHPETGQPYTWLGTPLWDLVPGQLPELTALHRVALERLCVRHGAVDPLLRLAATEVRRREGADLPPATLADVTARRPRYEAYARGALRNEASELAVTSSGGRNGQLNTAAFQLSRLIPYGLLTETDIKSGLYQSCIMNGLAAEDGERACLRTIESGLRAGASEPLRMLPQIDPTEVFAGRPAAIMPAPPPETGQVSVNDLYYIAPLNQVAYLPTMAFWGTEATDRMAGRVELHPGVKLSASKWLARRRAATSVCWAPGEPRTIPGRHLLEGGWTEHAGALTLNTYRPPAEHAGGIAERAGPWREHLRKLYPDEADEIERWFAHRAQKPGEKINHALVLGGAPGIGKDTLLHPLQAAVGPWNFISESPRSVAQDQFNPYVRSVVLRIDEARDMGEVKRYAFYEQMKTLEAAPPDVIRCNEKFAKKVPVLNVTGIVYTTNHRDALFLPEDDRRHFVAWSDITADELGGDEYFSKIWRWLVFEGGTADVVAWLRSVDLTSYNAKSPPRKTSAFFAMVQAEETEDDLALSSIINDTLGRPAVLTLDIIRNNAGGHVTLLEWLGKRDAARQIPHKLQRLGYARLANRDAGMDRRWKMGGNRVTVFARTDIKPGEAYQAAAALRRSMIKTV
jgi:hypothetical protein